MKFLLRPPFVLHLERIVERHRPDGKKYRELQVDSHFSNPVTPTIVELNEKQALTHLHKVEAADDSARELMAREEDKRRQRRLAQAMAQAPAPADPQLISTIVAATIEAQRAARVSEKRPAQ